ncbi:flagellar biosynthesis anti-sigma factor FlgM [Candidatus Poribacteria bacterium]|nr:flagellar biosynthesis anti-sigma factor FlgM [Candidatus Poribacteria bacterium]
MRTRKSKYKKVKYCLRFPRTTQQAVKFRRKDFSVSRHNKEVQKYIKMAKNVSHIRQDKIEELKKLIESGEYKIDSDKVAQSIIELHKDICSKKSSDK